MIVIDQGNFHIKDKAIKFANTWECLILTNSVLDPERLCIRDF